ncbi:hypothetical protein G5I_13652 [Acromyrmex echinatior]|uniref:Uncharacterized protein n=1 Tax=Acromyrmex echinatior TaxID=103372 RepID=F4X5L7_ACREC|nr:hypothetical protein G5I_13652 [Acromyrmex echinatior]
MTERRLNSPVPDAWKPLLKGISKRLDNELSPIVRDSLTKKESTNLKRTIEVVLNKTLTRLGLIQIGDRQAPGKKGETPKKSTEPTKLNRGGRRIRVCSRISRGSKSKLADAIDTKGQPKVDSTTQTLSSLESKEAMENSDNWPQG